MDLQASNFLKFSLRSIRDHFWKKMDPEFKNGHEYSGVQNFKKLLACKSILARPTFALTIVSRKNDLISSSRIPSGAVRRQGPKTRGVMDSQSRKDATTKNPRNTDFDQFALEITK